jgi:hypothetical protein
MMNDEQIICALIRRSADPLRAVEIAMTLALAFIAPGQAAPPVQPDASAQTGGS